jgi:hypothetical protein
MGAFRRMMKRIPPGPKTLYEGGSASFAAPAVRIIRKEFE